MEKSMSERLMDLSELLNDKAEEIREKTQRSDA